MQYHKVVWCHVRTLPQGVLSSALRQLLADSPGNLELHLSRELDGGLSVTKTAAIEDLNPITDLETISLDMAWRAAGERLSLRLSSFGGRIPLFVSGPSQDAVAQLADRLVVGLGLETIPEPTYRPRLSRERLVEELRALPEEERREVLREVVQADGGPAGV